MKNLVRADRPFIIAWRLTIALCLAVASNLLVHSSALAVDVTVTVTIPETSTTTTSFNVSICEGNTLETSSCRGRSGSIAAGQTARTVTVRFVNPGTKFIRTSCTSGCRAPLVRQGFFSGNGQSSTDFDQRSNVIIGNENTTLNAFALATGSTLSGVLSTPVTQGTNRSVDFDACPDDGGECESIRLTLPANQTSFSYAIGVAPNKRYELSFDCTNCADPLFDQGFYAAGSANTTSTVRDNATLIDGAQDVGNLNMRIVLGNVITGTVTSPIVLGSLANAQVRARDTSGDFFESRSFSIAAGQSNATYSIAVAPENTWTLEVSCSGCTSQGVFRTAFFAENEANTSFWADSRATEFSGDTQATVKNLNLFLGTTISGDVIMPDASRSSFIDFDVFAFNVKEGANFVGSASINSSQSSDNYLINVPQVFTAEDPLIVGVMPDIDGPPSLFSESYVPYAFYDGTTNSQTDRAEALEFGTSGTLSGFDIRIETGNVISGTINVPDEENASRDLLIHMIGDRLSNNGADLNGIPLTDGNEAYGGYGGDQDSGNYLYAPINAGLINYVPLQISANAGSSRFYSFRIPSDAETSWRTYYGCLNCGNEFQQYGFFRGASGDALNPEQTVAFASRASFVPGGSNYSHNLVLLKPSEEFCVPITTANGSHAVICL